MEIGGLTLNFLDLTLIKFNGGIEYDWYHKPTFSGRYINFMSQHPLSQKMGTIMGLVDRAFLLSVPKFHKKNLIFVIETLLCNDYPLDIIFNTINDRLKSLVNKKTANQQNTDTIMNNVEEIKTWFIIPYIRKMTDRFTEIAKNLSVKLAICSLNKLNCFIKAQKDCLTTFHKRNVIYKINCNDCDASYVGQTKRTLGVRIKEHKNDIRKRNGNLSVLSEHRLNLNHDFDWEDVKIMDTERWFYRRRISEMLYIKLQKNSLNLQSDTDFLHESYMPILEQLR
ncbi:hypothetical protein ALC57_13796 [Trachymyrmex cornetzi]|uniref:Helix-turn-helix domain-containing protein n=2 Tax=Trachymyrmex cornetzi TaxID=471704 RepID=A0A151IZ43_9HYME|nr:hypothetical protein ALC57_13796 [Trachymyrmex cornetzi]